MAEVTDFRNNALPYAVYGAPYTVVFPILDNTGALVSGAAGLDSERSLNGNTFADCTNEATEIGSTGMYYLSLTAFETVCDILTIIVKTSTTNAKTTPIVLYLKKLPTIRTGTCQGGTSSTMTLDTGASAVDNAYTGMMVIGYLDTIYESRLIQSYDGSTKIATVTPNWVTTPDSDDSFTLVLPDGVQVATVNTTAWNNAAVATPLVAGIPKVQPVDQGWRQP